MKRQDRLGMRVNVQDKLAWKEAARAENKSLSAWVEARLNEASQERNES